MSTHEPKKHLKYQQQPRASLTFLFCGNTISDDKSKIIIGSKERYSFNKVANSYEK